MPRVFPAGAVVKNPTSAGAAGDTGSIPGLGRSPGENMAPSILAWGTPWIEETGGLWFMGAQKSQTGLK